MDNEKIIRDWIEAGNRYDIERYLEFYHDDAVLNDPSVGKRFIGIKEIREYFVKYFIGYQTQTELKKLGVKDNTAYLEVEFTGSFPERKIGGCFDFIFRDGKMVNLRADLL